MLRRTSRGNPRKSRRLESDPHYWALRICHYTLIRLLLYTVKGDSGSTSPLLTCLLLRKAEEPLAVRLPAGFPKDPADRLIAATAIVEGVPLVTADERIRQAKVVQAIW
jgi:hypothetical protein